MKQVLENSVSLDVLHRPPSFSPARSGKRAKSREISQESQAKRPEAAVLPIPNQATLVQSLPVSKRGLTWTAIFPPDPDIWPPP